MSAGKRQEPNIRSRGAATFAPRKETREPWIHITLDTRHLSTKDRFPHLDRELALECHAYLGGIIENCDGKPIIVGGYRDHVHLLFDLPATQSVADFVRNLKSNSSKWIHEKWPHRSKFQWQSGCTSSREIVLT